jgi:hypothetical protein
MAPFDPARVKPSPRRVLPPSRAPLAALLLVSYAATWALMKACRTPAPARPPAPGPFAYAASVAV